MEQKTIDLGFKICIGIAIGCGLTQVGILAVMGIGRALGFW